MSAETKITDAELIASLQKQVAFLADEAKRWMDACEDRDATIAGLQHLADRAADADGDVAITFDELEQMLQDKDSFTIAQPHGELLVFVDPPFPVRTRRDVRKLLECLNGK